MIDRLTFKNFRVLQDVSLDLERFTVLVGPNACGKTTVLEAVMHVRDAEMHHGTTEWSEEFDWADVTSAGTEGPIFVVAGRQGSELTATKSEAWRGATVHERQVPVSRVEGIRTHLRAARFVNLDARKLRAPSPHAAGQQIEADGTGLGGAVAELALEDVGRRRQISEFLAKIVPSVEDVSAKRVAGGETLYEIVIRFEKIGPVQAARLSEGTLYALGLITLLTAVNAPSLLLIDDIDKGLHPSAQTELVKILRQFLENDPKLQIIATTHSPYLLDNFDPKEVRVFNLGGDGFARCRNLTDHPKFEKWQGAMAAGELWASVGEEWIRTDDEA